MDKGVSSFIDAFRQNPKSAIAGVILLALLYFTSNQAAIDSLPAENRALIENILQAVKYGILAFGAYYTFRGPSEREIHEKLEKIQEKPDQTVLPTKELVVAAPVLQNIAAAPLSTEIVISTSAPSTQVTRTKKSPKKTVKKKTVIKLPIKKKPKNEN